ncbi:glycoside hydrolase family 79 protein, putative [Rhizoctonia solani AG-3 Rhs1AP]|uniref:Glycoside hydrolase family 79 protein, putative n=1 Tax=Rhizoctonia solani AG-3 Rhs1AP TaxID=1086054 RepID=A0A0A1UK62_9AGAM|nr:glycoside hydrolase family 79 protein, putative [Rhizoctonia solani AG-3 Rhs1AP]
MDDWIGVLLDSDNYLARAKRGRIVNLAANNNDNLSPGYVVYEDGAPSRVLLIYYIDDNTGAHDATARIQIGGGDGVAVSPLTQVRVKYFSAPSVSFKGNMTWAGQTLGNHFESDGRLQGSEVIETIQCQNNICPIPLKAPSLALVFLTDAALANSSPASSATASFETSVLTRIRHTATVDQEVLSTSNGRGGHWGNPVGSTSFGSVGAAVGGFRAPSVGVLVGLVVGVAAVVGLRW